MDKPLILISNDDGIDAKGIHALVDFVTDLGEVWVIAPSTPQSGQSSAITVEQPLRVVQHPDYNGAKMFSVTGTPVDSVKLGTFAILPRQPDIVLSGINHGGNTGVSVLYSGTMGVVYEGCVRGIPSVGFSSQHFSPDADFISCEKTVRDIVIKVLKSGLPAGICLNVNMPKDEIIKGVKIAKAASGVWVQEYANNIDPHGRPYYWLTGKYDNHDADSKETDLYWLSEGYASVVPCHIEQTAFDAMTEIGEILN